LNRCNQLDTGWQRIRNLLFDFGGTLDLPGAHWLDRFLRHYHEAGIKLTRAELDLAYADATRRGYRAGPRIYHLGLQELLDQLVNWQIEYLLEHLSERVPSSIRAAAAPIAARFCAESMAGYEQSRTALAALAPRFAIGVVSNFYGNLEAVLREAGLMPYVAAAIDSSRVGVFKPDPAIYELALARLRARPEATAMVGDSLDKDCAPARRMGLKTVRLERVLIWRCATFKNWLRIVLEPIEGAILAAGRGERLRAKGSDLPKPLVVLDGEPLLARQGRILLEAGASRVVAVVNSETAALIDRDAIVLPSRLTLVVRDTPNSMETLFELGEHLASGWFLAATVDTVLGPGDMTRFAQRATALTRDSPAAADGVLGVVQWRGDERPLFVDVETSGGIRKVGGACGATVTAGVYFLPSSIFAFRARAREAGLAALREFLSRLVDWGVRLNAVAWNEVIDIDVASDLEAARAMLARANAGGPAGTS